MFNDNQKKNYSEMQETELNIDENYLEIFQDELNNILGNDLNKKTFLNGSDKNITRLDNKNKPNKPNKPNNSSGEIKNKYLKKKMINKSKDNIIKDNLKHTKKLYDKINKNDPNNINNKNNKNDKEKNNIDNEIILDSKDILAIKMLIKYLNNK
jgi:hypothetical protein